jgi:hypothetical protein
MSQILPDTTSIKDAIEYMQLYYYLMDFDTANEIRDAIIGAGYAVEITRDSRQIKVRDNYPKVGDSWIIYKYDIASPELELFSSMSGYRFNKRLEPRGLPQGD